MRRGEISTARFLVALPAVSVSYLLVLVILAAIGIGSLDVPGRPWAWTLHQILGFPFVTAAIQAPGHVLNEWSFWGLVSVQVLSVGFLVARRLARKYPEEL